MAKKLLTIFIGDVRRGKQKILNFLFSSRGAIKGSIPESAPSPKLHFFQLWSVGDLLRKKWAERVVAKAALTRRRLAPRLIPFILSIVLIVSSLILLKTNAQELPAAMLCGDGIVQSPNSEGFYEKCDEVGETKSCTSQCGQKLLGWAWSDNIGWISLSNENCDFLAEGTCQNQNYNYYVQAKAAEMADGEVKGEIIGWGWSDNIGWVCFGQTCQGYSDLTPPDGWQTYAKQAGTNDPLVFGWAWNESIGLISLNCGLNSIPCETSDYQLKLIKSDFGSVQRLTLLGWAWSDISGWTSFTPEISDTLPWLQTKYGDIYARKGILGNEPPDYGYNATYQIISGDIITNFRSARGEDWIKQGFQEIGFPRPSTRYSNVLGKINISDLLCDLSVQNTCINKFGKIVEKIIDENNSGNIDLSGKIYYRDGNLVIDNPINFMNAVGFDDGSGTIIVNGDLVINSDVKYDNSTSPIIFKNLASAAFIVLGDLKISPNVSNLAGNFIIIGNGNDCNPNQESEVTGCGQIYTCCVLSGESCAFDERVCQQNPLIVSGLMMAKKFYLKRIFITDSQDVQGSEIIIYDGRLLANTPPGLGDFAKSMPIWHLDFLSQ